jgi:hypothetical protein
MNKNADGAMDYLDSVLSATSLADLQKLVADAKFLAFVQRQAGGGRLFLTLQTSASRDEKDHVNLPIRNVIRFKGSAASDAKKAQANTMQRGDYVIVDGAYAAARLTVAQATAVRRVFNRYEVPVPKGFFSELEADEDDEDGGFAIDRSEEEEAEERAEEERQAAIARRAIVKAGGAGRGGAPRVSVRTAVEALADREEGEAAADRVEEDEDDMPAEAAGDAEKPKRTGPNRAERRAAAAAEAAARAAAEEVANGLGFSLYADAADEEEDWTAPALPAHNPTKGWEELADELDIDAI